MKNSSSHLRILSIVVFGVLIGLSIWFGSAFASSEAFHHKDIAYLEGKQNNAKALSASASAASVLVSLLPEDTATPLANQISDISRDFLIVLSALSAEQFLLTITGRITFCWLLPIALGIIILFILLRRKLFLQIGVKLALGGCVLYMLVPVTLRITRLVDRPYQEAVDNSLQQSGKIEDAFHYNEDGVVMPGMSDDDVSLQTPASEEEGQPVIQTEAAPEEKGQSETQTEARTDERKKKQEEKLPWYERLVHSVSGAASGAADTASRVADAASNAAHKISDTAQAAADKVKEAGESISELAALTAQVPQMAADLLNSLIDAFVLMVVTTCVLPLFVLIGMLWVMNQVLNINPDWSKMET